MAKVAPVPAEIVDQFSNHLWRLNNLYWITDKEGRRVRFELNWAQEQLVRDMHYLNIVLKARQLGFCLDPSTRVLTADLTWVPISKLTPGQQIVSVDEFPAGGKGRARRMRTATVVASVEVLRKAYRITFDDGRSVVCTGKHPWLSKKAGSSTDWRRIEEGSKKSLNVGTYVRWVTKPWGEPTFEDGWFGGMLDGEGSISKRNTAAGVNVSQRPGAVWDRMVRYCESRGYNHCIEADDGERKSKFGTTPVPKIAIGRMDEMFRLIGQTRPTRFLGNHFWEGRELPGKRNGGVGWAKITKIEPLGEQTMVDLQTSTGTYIAEGFVSHNTTFIQIYMLDAAVFFKDTRCGVIAHTRDDAEAIFRDKIKFPYDNLPEQIRAANPIVKNNTTTLELANNSSIRVGTSLRGGTLQYLHISEFGKVCAKYPEKAREIVTGALNTIDAGQVAFIESTAEGQEGRFYEMCQSAQSAQRRGDKLSPLDWKFFFFPWWKHPGYRTPGDGVAIPDGYRVYFEELETRHGIKLDPDQRAWYAKKAETQGADMKREFPSTPEEAFEASVEGAYYADQMARAELDGRIGHFPPYKSLPVHTVWDIGVGDYTTIWFFQVTPTRVRWVGYYHNSGEGIPHYLQHLVDRVERMGWTYGDHWLPHDAKVKEWGTGRTRVEQFKDGIILADGSRFKPSSPRIVPMHAVDDGINALRSTLGISEFDEEECADGIKALNSYRKEWDEEHGVWKNRPRHDWASHGADSARYGAMAYREVSMADIGPPPGPKLIQNAKYRDVMPKLGVAKGRSRI